MPSKEWRDLIKSCNSEDTEPIRKVVQNYIMDTAEEIPIVSEPAASWIVSKEWDAFIKALFQLKKYYELSRDEVMSVEIASFLVDYLRLIAKSLIYDDLTPEQRQQLIEGFDALATSIDLIALQSPVQSDSEYAG